MSETEEEVRTYTLEELEGRARDRAMDKLREWNTAVDWYGDVQADWAENVLPETWCIKCVEANSMWFDWYRGRSLALTGGRLYIRELATKHPATFDNLIIRTMMDRNMLMDWVSIRLDNRGKDTMGIDDIDIHVDLEGTPFAGMSDDDFLSLAEKPLNDLHDTLSEWVCRAARECLEALDDEYEYLTSDECIEEMAESNNYRFDEDGEVVR